MSAPQPEVPAGCHLIVFDSVDSTNQEAKALAQSGASAGTVVWARQQVAGRGRHGRSWSSPPGNLYLSVIQRPDCRPADAPQLGFVAGVALAETLGRLSDIPVTLKWPNDLMANGKKASGILLESAADADGRMDWLIIGTGVNVELSPADLPDVTSLHEEGAKISVEALLSTFLERLFWHIGQWQEHGFQPIRERWMSYALPVGTQMRVKMPGGDVLGRFSGIDERGSLLLGSNGDARRIDMGDIFPVPATNERAD